MVSSSPYTMSRRSKTGRLSRSRMNTKAQQASPPMTDEGYLTSSETCEGSEEQLESIKEEQDGEIGEEACFRQRRRKLKKPWQDDKDDSGRKAAEDEEQDACVAPNGYAVPIRIYKCLKRPEEVAYDICLWEQQHCIDQLVDVHPDTPIGTNIFIPDDALFIIVGENMTAMPYGQALVFARVHHPYTSYQFYEPAIGFYYNYAGSRSTCWSMKEYFDDANMAGIVDLYERVRPETPHKFREIFGMISQIVDNEMVEVEQGRRYLRNCYGPNRVNATRWRSRIVGDEGKTACVY
jgi:hypothetical protein